jgi:hypothetical protein
MGTLIAVSVTCWLCALVALPRKPRLGNEVEELIYARLLGRQRRVALLAIGVTAALLLTAIVALPQQVNAVPTAPATASCADEMICPWMYGK